MFTHVQSFSQAHFPCFRFPTFLFFIFVVSPKSKVTAQAFCFVLFCYCLSFWILAIDKTRPNMPQNSTINLCGLCFRCFCMHLSYIHWTSLSNTFCTKTAQSKRISNSCLLHKSMLHSVREATIIVMRIFLVTASGRDANMASWAFITHTHPIRAQFVCTLKIPVNLIFDSCIYCRGNFFKSGFCSTHSSSVSSFFAVIFSCSSTLLAVFPITTVEVDFAWNEHKTLLCTLWDLHILEYTAWFMVFCTSYLKEITCVLLCHAVREGIGATP